MTVLRGFIAGANAQYRNAGLDKYQMRVHKDGSVTVPNRPAPAFPRVPGTGSAAGEQASAGASQGSAPTAGAAPASGAASGADAPRGGSSPTFTSLKPTKAGFALRWEPVAGAQGYGVWVDGALVGHVPKPAFDGTLSGRAGGVVQIDAIAADGMRTPLTAPMRIARGAGGRLDVSAPKPAASASALATAPAPAPAPEAAPATAPAAPAS